jgi:hypothetical protein
MGAACIAVDVEGFSWLLFKRIVGFSVFAILGVMYLFNPTFGRPALFSRTGGQKKIYVKNTVKKNVTYRYTQNHHQFLSELDLSFTSQGIQHTSTLFCTT